MTFSPYCPKGPDQTGPAFEGDCSRGTCTKSNRCIGYTSQIARAILTRAVGNEAVFLSFSLKREQLSAILQGAQILDPKTQKKTTTPISNVHRLWGVGAKP